MNIITIDPSFHCTAMCINDSFYIYTNPSKCYTKTKSLNNWFKRVNNIAKYNIYDLDKSKNYQINEIFKLDYANKVGDGIINDITSNINADAPTIISIEGYSYMSVTNAILDLVTMGTTIRCKIYNAFPDAIMYIIPPTTLKLKACEFTYGVKYDGKGKKITSTNNIGVSGGKFKKPDMLLSLLDNKKLTNDWYVNVLKNDFNDLIDKKNIPNPIEDINDTKILYEIILDICKNNNYDLENIKKQLF